MVLRGGKVPMGTISSLDRLSRFAVGQEPKQYSTCQACVPIGPFVTLLSGQWDADDKRARDVTLRFDASLDDLRLLLKPLSIERLPSAQVIRILFVWVEIFL